MTRLTGEVAVARYDMTKNASARVDAQQYVPICGRRPRDKTNAVPWHVRARRAALPFRCSDFPRAREHFRCGDGLSNVTGCGESVLFVLQFQSEPP